MKIFATFFLYLMKIKKRFYMYIIRPKFKKYGKNFIYDPYGTYSFSTIEVGNDVFIRPGATLMASESGIDIGNKVMFGPNVTILGGDHNTSVIGKYMYDVKKKKHGDDLPVLISNDVWLGCGCTILKGVTIGEGAIVAAGALVVKNVSPYSIVGGVPARLLKNRFTTEELKKHKMSLDVWN